MKKTEKRVIYILRTNVGFTAYVHLKFLNTHHHLRHLKKPYWLSGRIHLLKYVLPQSTLQSVMLTHTYIQYPRPIVSSDFFCENIPPYQRVPFQICFFFSTHRTHTHTFKHLKTEKINHHIPLIIDIKRFCLSPHSTKKGSHIQEFLSQIILLLLREIKITIGCSSCVFV